MHFDANSVMPLYQQVADAFTAGILSGAFPEGDQIPSTTEVSRQYQLNPATVLKGMNQLVAAGLIEKRRGLGMFVTTGAQAKLKAQRQSAFYSQEVATLLKAARQLGISKADLLAAIERGYGHE